MIDDVVVMREHPAWTTTGQVRRAFAGPDGERWIATVSGRTLSVDALGGTEAELPVGTFALPAQAAGEVPELAGELAGLGRVVRVGNPDLWDAVAVAIVRQVIRADHARRLYQEFCAVYGERVGESLALFPRPEAVLDLSDDDFATTGMAFKRPALRAAATTFGEHGDRWRKTDPEELVRDLQQVPRIGPWTAQAAVADWANRFDLYPCGDLAVRTWAARAVPGHDWPTDEPGFDRAWRALAGEHLHEVTLLTLAWGGHHANTTLDEAVSGADLTRPLDALFINAPLRDYGIRPRVNDFTLPVLGMGYIATYAAHQGQTD